MPIICWILTAAALTISGAFINRWRGGWNINVLGIERHGIKRAITAVIPTLSLLIPFYDFVDCWVWLVCYLSFLIAGIAPGWGSWFFIGRSETSWDHNSDAFWAEWISYLRFGPKWIPSNHGLDKERLEELLSRYNIIMSPEGEARPKEWRIRMEYFAMCIRGLSITVPVALILYFYFFFDANINLWQLIFIAPIGYSLGQCYSIGHEINLKKLPEFLRASTKLGEFLTGGLIFGLNLFTMSSFVASFIK